MIKDRKKVVLKMLEAYDARLDDDCKMSAEQLAFYATRLAHLDQAILTKALDKAYSQYGRRKLPTVNELMAEYRDVLQGYDDEMKRREMINQDIPQEDPEIGEGLRALFSLISKAPELTRQEYNDRMVEIDKGVGVAPNLPLYTQHLDMKIRAARAKRLPK